MSHTRATVYIIFVHLGSGLKERKKGGNDRVYVLCLPD